MKGQTACTNTTTLGPFFRMMLMLAEQRARTEGETSSLSGVATADATRKTSSEKAPVCRSPIALGPFMTMILTLAKRTVEEQRYPLRSLEARARSG